MHKIKIISLLLGISLLFLVTRLLFLNSGLYFVEPDEWSWDSASESFYHSFIPKVAGRYLFDQIPLFELLAFLVSFVIKDSLFPRTFLDIRLVSVLASAVVALVLYRYLKQKVGVRAGLWGVLLFILVPLSLFYSRYGGREMLLILFSLLFYWSFENLRSSERKIGPVLRSGVFLGLAIYAKLTALIFLAVPLAYLALAFISEFRLLQTGFNAVSIKLKWERKWFDQAWVNLLLVGVALVMTALAFVPFLLVNATFLRDRLYLVIFSHGSSSLFGKLQILSTYLTKPVYWLTLTGVLLVILGVIWVVRTNLRKWQDLLFFTILTLGFLVTNEARARYFAVSLPFLIILASLGMVFLTDLVAKRFKKAGWLVPLLVLATILPSTWKAIESTNHSGFEQAVKILVEKKDGRLVYSSYWPPIIQYISGLPAVRLTDKIEDATRDHNEYPEFSPNVAVPPTQLLEEKDGGWVLIHEPIDRDDFSERKRAIEYVKGNYDAFAKISDGKPNFPETDEPYTIYLFDTKARRQ